jgi:hypothetical protein
MIDPLERRFLVEQERMDREHGEWLIRLARTIENNLYRNWWTKDGQDLIAKADRVAKMLEEYANERSCSI